MGKEARKKWARKFAAMQSLSANIQSLSAETPRRQVGVRLGLAGTFLIAAIANAVSNGPWEISSGLFFMTAAFVFAAIWNFFQMRSRLIPKIAAASSLIVSTLFICWMANMVMRIPIDLSDSAKARFTTTLRSIQVKPEFVIVSCSPTNEEACAFAEQFIPLFQRAGWKVEGPTVFRDTLGRNAKDVVTADYGPPLVNPQNPDEGVWTVLTGWWPYEEIALKELQIKFVHANDTGLPKTKTRIYFGTAPSRTLVDAVKKWLSVVKKH